MVVTGPDQDEIAAILPWAASAPSSRSGAAPATPCAPAWSRCATSRATSWCSWATRRSSTAQFLARASRQRIATAGAARHRGHGRARRPGALRPHRARTQAAAWRASSRRATPTPDELLITEVNTGFYVFDAALLRAVAAASGAGQRPGRAVPHRRRASAARRRRSRSTPTCADDPEVMLAINSRVELAAVNAVMRRRLLERLMLAGVTVEDPASDLRGLGRRGGPRHGPPRQHASAGAHHGRRGQRDRPGQLPARRLRRRPRPGGELAPATSA